MRYLTHAFFVAILSLNASGALSLVLPEPCSIIETAGEDDGKCPPTCVRCGCCAQPAVPALFEIAASAAAMTSSAAPFSSDVLSTTPRDILHVPKL